MKKTLGPSPTIYPMPALLVGTYSDDGLPNAMATAWAGACSAEPPCVGVAIRPNRRTHHNIQARRAFTVNVPSVALAAKVDYLGIVSGNDEPNKLARAGISTAPGNHIDAPLVLDCPINLECRLAHSVDLNCHVYFIGEVIEVHCDESLVGADGKIDVAALAPLVYCTSVREYWGLGEPVGKAYSIGKSLATGRSK